MSRNTIKCAMLLTTALGLQSWAQYAHGAPLKAFSLREANRALEEGREDGEVLQTVGGITRFAGMLFDRDTGDIILVGRARRDLPMTSLDDLVVALRSRLVKREFPLVSIDRTDETSETGWQKVRFEGGIEKTRFGERFLDSDVMLKLYSLDLMRRSQGLAPYLKLYEEATKKNLEDQGHTVSDVTWLSEDESRQVVEAYKGKNATEHQTAQSRFWFHARTEESFVVEVDDIYIIEELRLGVNTEQVLRSFSDAEGQRDDDTKDEVGEEFAAQFTEQFRQACEDMPPLGHLKVLYDLVAISEGIAHLGEDRPPLEELVNNYPVAAIDTPEKYRLVRRIGEFRTEGGATKLIQLSGGIEMEVILEALEEGDVEALRHAVLASRPNPRSLCWTIPINDWEMPNDEPTPDEAEPGDEVVIQPDELGFSLGVQEFTFDPARPGNPDLKFEGFPPLPGVPRLEPPPFAPRVLNRLRGRPRIEPPLAVDPNAGAMPGWTQPNWTPPLPRGPAASPISPFNGNPGLGARNPRFDPRAIEPAVNWPQNPFGPANMGPAFDPVLRPISPLVGLDPFAARWLPLSEFELPQQMMNPADQLGRWTSGPLGMELLPPGPARIDGPSITSPLLPSNVGGVYLGGAGEAVQGLGRLEGIGIDERTGRLLLLSQDEAPVELPPLRLDDVVTIFRSVYLFGEAPLVSIDPDPDDPHGPTMNIRHGQATADTYVGWVLFEADRIMKAYSLGCDNITSDPIQTKIEDYQDLFDLGLFDLGRKPGESNWERYWIVPSHVERRRSSRGELTLLDVALKAKTQPMKWSDGKLHPDEDREPSKAATAFTKWFTEHYDDLAREARSVPPGDVADGPVSFFAELRRIAHVTAIAEALRDQGVPFPAWMRDFEVAPCPMTRTTPSIVVQRTKTKTTEVVVGQRIKTSKQTQDQRIYGGVNLTAPNEDINTTEAAPEAERLVSQVVKETANAATLEPVKFEDAGQTYEAVALPGEATRDVCACRLDAVDLVIPLSRGAEIRLTRKYHSFFRVDGALGRGWTTDLPFLEKRPLPEERTETAVKGRWVYQLTSPLGTWSATFDQTVFVPEVNVELLVPRQNQQILGLGPAEDERFGMPTLMVKFRDGRQWHFDPEAGHLIARQSGPLTVMYGRDSDGRIGRIEGHYADALPADIQLDYDDQGRLVHARGSDGQDVAYTYDASSHLTRAAGPMGTVAYRYQGRLLAEVVAAGRFQRRFEYDGQGRLVREQRAGCSPITYRSETGPDGIKVQVASQAGQGGNATVPSAHYDTAGRPVAKSYSNGTEIRWEYGPDGSVLVKITSSQGEEYIARRLADDDSVIWETPEGGKYAVQLDQAARVTEISRGGQPLVRQEWYPVGLLKTWCLGTTALRPQYDENLMQTGLLITPPGDEGEFQRWMLVGYDESGRPAKISDNAGNETEIGYDGKGRLESVVSGRGEMRIARSPGGTVQSVKASWGVSWNNRFDPSAQRLVGTQVSLGDNKASVELKDNLPTRVQQFDGGQYRFSHHRQGQQAGLLQAVQLPNDLKIRFAYDAAQRVTGVTYGDTIRQNVRYDRRGRVTEITRTPAIN